MKVSNLDTSTNCDTKNAWGPLGCMSSDTIAYAPYDKVGDLNMYYKGESFYNNEKISMLPVKTNGWIQPGSMGNDMTMSIIL